MEEMDVLRVEHANDVTTIQELRMCLEDEKRGSFIEQYNSTGLVTLGEAMLRRRLDSVWGEILKLSDCAVYQIEQLI